MPLHHKNIRLEHWNYLGQRRLFTTLCCANRRKHFASAKFSAEFLDILRANAATYEFAVHAYSFLAVGSSLSPLFFAQLSFVFNSLQPLLAKYGGGG